MNVYDFDGTIYSGDSTADFFLFALKSNPALIRFLPKQIKGFLLYALKKIDKTRMKEYFFSFLRGINAPALVEDFWDVQQQKIYSWYLAQKDKNDLVISASPEFLLMPICKRLGLHNLIASKVDAASGRFLGKNCYGEEKAIRFKAIFGEKNIQKFYSNSKSDLPMAILADQAYLVDHDFVRNWERASVKNLL